jgi:hypothetical protein
MGVMFSENFLERLGIFTIFLITLSMIVSRLPTLSFFPLGLTGGEGDG